MPELDDATFEQLLEQPASGAKSYAELADEGMPIPRWLVEAEQSGALLATRTLH